MTAKLTPTQGSGGVPPCEAGEGRRRVVITGLGVNAAGGQGREAFWRQITSGRSATRRITHFDPDRFRSQMAGEVEAAGLEPGLDRGIGLLKLAGREAIADAGAIDAAPQRLGVTVGTAVGPTLELIRLFEVLTGHGEVWQVPPGAAEPGSYPCVLPSTFAAELATMASARGPVATFSSGCTSGIDAVARGAEMIRRGHADVVLAGGADAPLSPISVAGFDAIKATSANNDNPDQACRPFDAGRDGFVLAEGAAVLVLETAERAAARGARIYAEISGFGASSNGFHMTGLTSDGVDLSWAIERALDGVPGGAEVIDYVNAHGSGTVQNDRHETAAVKRALGEQAWRTMMSSIKSAIGHSLGAVGAIEIAACAMAIREGMVPPTANLMEPDDACDLDYVPLSARPAALRAALSTASGFGGFQSAMVLSAPESQAVA